MYFCGNGQWKVRHQSKRTINGLMMTTTLIDRVSLTSFSSHTHPSSPNPPTQTPSGWNIRSRSTRSDFSTPGNPHSGRLSRNCRITRIHTRHATVSSTPRWIGSLGTNIRFKWSRLVAKNASVRTREKSDGRTSLGTSVFS